MKTFFDFLYCKNGFNASCIVVIDNEIVKWDDYDIDFHNSSKDEEKLNEIKNLIKDKNFKGIIVVQDGNVQNYYGDRETLEHLKETICIFPGNGKYIEEGLINFNYK